MNTGDWPLDWVTDPVSTLVWSEFQLIGKLAVWKDDANVAKTRVMCETAARKTTLEFKEEVSEQVVVY